MLHPITFFLQIVVSIDWSGNMKICEILENHMVGIYVTIDLLVFSMIYLR